MHHESNRSKYIFLLILSGATVSVLSALEPHWEALALLCGRFGQGCRQAESFTLFSLPIAWWGIGFYLVLAGLQRFKYSWMFWAVAVGCGVELYLVYLMVTLNFFCLFCIINLLVMVLLLFRFLKRKTVWQFISICLAGFILSHTIIRDEHRSPVKSEMSASRLQNETTMGKGVAQGVVTIVEFSDYRCPACKRMHPITTAVKEMYKDKIRWVFKDFPLKNHKNSDRLAEAARCAEAKGKFTEFQDLLFGAETLPDLEMLQDFAVMLDLDPSEFSRCYEERRYAENVQENKRDGKAVGVNSTPTFIINGQLMVGMRSLDEFRERIDNELVKIK